MIEHEINKSSEYYRSIPLQDRWLFTCMKFNQIEELLEQLLEKLNDIEQDN